MANAQRRIIALALGALAAISTLLWMPLHAQAATRTWTGTASALWSNPANWGGTAPVNGDSLVFPVAGLNTLTVDDIASLSVVDITFQAPNYAINPSGGPSLTVTTSIHSTAVVSGPCDTFSLPITVSGAFTMNTALGGDFLCFNNPITGGANPLTVSGAGSTSLLAANTFGSVTIDNTLANATLNISNGAALGAGTVTIGNGGGNLAALSINGPLTVANAIALNGGAITDASGSVTLSGPITLGAAVFVPTFINNTAGLGTLDITGTMSGGNGPRYIGAGVIRVFGVNSTTGASTVGAVGPFATDVIAENTSALGTSPMTVIAGSALTTNLAAPGTFTNNLTLNGTGGIYNGALSVMGANTTFSGTVAIGGGQTTVIANDTGLTSTISGIISGAGTVQYNGAAPSAVLVVNSGGNTFSGGLDVVGGKWACSVGPACTATVNITIETAGTLQLIAGSNQLPAATDLVINGAGLFDMNSQIQTLHSITYNGAGGSVYDGVLTMTGNIISSGTSVGARLGFNAGAGTLTLAPGSVFNVAAGGATPDLKVNLQVIGVNGVTKQGGGILLLAANDTYTGTTAVNGGTLWVDGSQPGSNVTLASGTTLGGVGTVGSITSTGGTVSPGHSPGILTSAALTLDSASTFSAQLNGTVVGTGYSQLITSGVPSLGNSALNLVFGFAPAGGTNFTLISNTSGSAVSGTFAGLPEGAFFVRSGHPLQITYVGGGSGRDVVLRALTAFTSGTTLTSSPNPSSQGQSVTFTATVSGPGGVTPTGTVTFSDGGTTLGTVAVNGSGQAVFTTTGLAMGSRTIQAAYSGDSLFAASSGTLGQTVGAAVSVPPSGAASALSSVPWVTAIPAGAMLWVGLMLLVVLRRRRRSDATA